MQMISYRNSLFSPLFISVCFRCFYIVEPPLFIYLLMFKQVYWLPVLDKGGIRTTKIHLKLLVQRKILSDNSIGFILGTWTSKHVI